MEAASYWNDFAFYERVSGLTDGDEIYPVALLRYEDEDHRYNWWTDNRMIQFLPFEEAVASRAVFVIVSWSDGRADGRVGGNAFGAS